MLESIGTWRKAAPPVAMAYRYAAATVKSSALTALRGFSRSNGPKAAVTEAGISPTRFLQSRAATDNNTGAELPREVLQDKRWINAPIERKEGSSRGNGSHVKGQQGGPESGASRKFRRGSRNHESGQAELRRKQMPFMERLKEARIQNDWQAAERVLEEALAINTDGKVVDVFMYNAVLGVIGEAGKSQNAFMLLKRMKQEGVKPDKYTYSAAITACGNGGQAEQAVGLLRQMKAEGNCAPSSYAYNAAIAACAKANQWEQAVKLLREMRQSTSGVVPDVFSYSSAITACGNCKKWGLAVGLLHEMLENDSPVKPNVVSYVATISSCGTSGQWEQALELLRGSQRSHSLSIANHVDIYIATIKACGNSGEWQMAVDLLREMEQSDSLVAPTRFVYTAVIKALAQAERGPRAETILREMQSKGGNLAPDTVAYSAVIAAYGNSGDWERAVGLFRELQNDRTATPDAYSYAATMTACGKCGRGDLALSLLMEMKTVGVFADDVSLRAAFEACQDENQRAEAKAIMAEINRDGNNH